MMLRRGLPAFACVGSMPQRPDAVCKVMLQHQKEKRAGDSDALSQGLIHSKEQSSVKVGAVFDASMNTSHEKTILRAMKF